MTEVEKLAPIGSHLATLNLFREANGEIWLTVAHMDPRLIETTGEEVTDRMAVIAAWAEEGLGRMRAAWKDNSHDR